jgi:diguanylate cyclase (GGDEF)-like protein
VRPWRASGLLLPVGLGFSALVLVSDHVLQALDWVTRQAEQQLSLQLGPAVVLSSAAFAWYQWQRRREVVVDAERVSTAIKEATSRADEMSRLVAFGHALTRFPDLDSVKAAALAHLPRLVPGRRLWVMTRTKGLWEPLVDVGDTALAASERAARHAVGEGGLQLGGNACFPMVIADTPVCVLGVAPVPLLTEHQRSVLTTAVALLAGALKNAELFREVHDNSLQDGLTGCFNRTHALEVLDGELRRTRRSKRPFTVLMFDIDTFKTINDRYGHLCGDAVLAAVGTRMRTALRSSDVKCRYGGDEFFVILPETPLVGARQVCETLRRAMEKDPVPWADGLVTFTASFGVTEIVPGEADALGIVARVDAALYRSKQAGRNRVTVAESSEAAPQTGKHVSDGFASQLA